MEYPFSVRRLVEKVEHPARGDSKLKGGCNKMEGNGMTAGEVLRIWDYLTRAGWTTEQILDFLREVASK